MQAPRQNLQSHEKAVTGQCVAATTCACLCYNQKQIETNNSSLKPKCPWNDGVNITGGQPFSPTQENHTTQHKVAWGSIWMFTSRAVKVGRGVLVFAICFFLSRFFVVCLLHCLFVYLFVCLFVCLLACLLARLFVWLLVCLCLFVCLFV